VARLSSFFWEKFFLKMKLDICRKREKEKSFFKNPQGLNFTA